ncbi:MAG: prepilin-type N-terminal cleavage/methylation domain-containing protein [Candidatus Omnitrophica bacterium]|nr:prepilin-type N-terminal cleavage/methylation domain-containing protein [Candidatus Omnitrophota bacterium]
MSISNRGLTLIEVLVSVGLISVLISAVTLISMSLFRSWPVESGHTEARLTASNVVESMLKELRAGLEISDAGDNQITFWKDLNDNGLKETALEDIAFSWSGLAGDGLYRSQGPGLNQEILENVDIFSITYFDQNSQPLSQPITLSLIRALKVDIQSQIDDEVIKLRFNVKLRNL